MVMPPMPPWTLLRRPSADEASIGPVMIRLREKPPRNWRLFSCCLQCLKEVIGGLEWLIGADQQGEVFCHLAGFDSPDTDILKRLGEIGQIGIIIELGAITQALGPGKDRGNGVCRSRLALLCWR